MFINWFIDNTVLNVIIDYHGMKLLYRELPNDKGHYNAEILGHLGKSLQIIGILYPEVPVIEQPEPYNYLEEYLGVPQ